MALPGILCAVLGPNIKEDVKILEGIQRRATKMVKGLEGMSCEEWLEDFGLV